MKTIRVIDLLNKIANGEEVPKKIKYKDFIYEYFEQETVIDYRCYDEKTELYGYLSSCVDYEAFNILDNEVEILEEEKKIPEKLDIYDELQSLLKDNNIDEHNLHKMLKKIELKQNEIIDYLKSKGDE